MKLKACFLFVILLALAACAGDPPPFSDSLLLLKDGSVMILTGGQLYRVVKGGGGVTQLQVRGVLTAALKEDGLLTGGRDGRVFFRKLAVAGKPGKQVYSADEPILHVAGLKDGLVAVTDAGIARMRSLTTKDADGIRTKVSAAAVSAGGRLAWRGPDGLFLATPGAVSGQALAKGALSFAFCGEDLYWAGSDKKIHYLKADRSSGLLRDFYPPDNSSLLQLGSSPDGRFLFGISEPPKGRPLFMSLDRQEGKIFMAPVPEGTTATAISRDNRLRYHFAGSVLYVYGFQQMERGRLQRIPLTEE